MKLSCSQERNLPLQQKPMRRRAAICCKDIARVVKNLKALIYLRVSTEEQAVKGYSIQAQRSESIKKALEIGCSMENMEFFSDEGISGAILERPQLMAALNKLKKERDSEKLFICYDSSRLSRNASHQLILIDEIKRCNARLIFLKNSYQDNAEGRFQLTVMAAVDEYERARLKLRTEMGKRAKAIQHKLTHNPGLYGYSFDPIKDELSIDEEQAKNLKFIFHLLTAEHIGPSEIAERLNASEVPSPRMKQWTRITVRRILNNPSYLGVLYIRRYDTRDCHLNKFKKKGEKIKIKERPRNEWIPVNIPQIIDRETWEAAQGLLKKTKHHYNKKSGPDFLLLPLLVCGICGSKMNSKSIIKENSLYRYYICINKYRESNEKCSSRLLNADSADKAVWEQISTRISEYACEDANMLRIAEELISEKEAYITGIKLKMEKLQGERERIIMLFQKSFIEEDEMRTKLNDIDKKTERLVTAITRSNEYSGEFVRRLKKGFSGENSSHMMKEILDQINDSDKRHLIELVLSEIIVMDNKVKLIERE